MHRILGQLHIGPGFNRDLSTRPGVLLGRRRCGRGVIDEHARLLRGVNPRPHASLGLLTNAEVAHTAGHRTSSGVDITAGRVEQIEALGDPIGDHHIGGPRRALVDDAQEERRPLTGRESGASGDLRKPQGRMMLDRDDHRVLVIARVGVGGRRGDIDRVADRLTLDVR